jgi:hypothetical protein
LARRELLTQPASFGWFDLAGQAQHAWLQPGELGFTLCQVPVTYRLGARRNVEVRWTQRPPQVLDGHALDARASQAVLSRSGQVAALVVSLVPEDLLPTEG